MPTPTIAGTRRRAPAGIPAVLAVLAAVLAVVLAACGSSGGGDVVRGGTSGSATPSSPAPSPSSSSASSSGGVHPAVTVEPATKLVSGQIVNVTATGFSPNEQLTVIQCADKGTATGQGDCNLSGMVPAQTDFEGKVIARIPVLRGPFGTNAVVCSSTQPCLISVTQATLNPTEEADARISFAG